MHCTDQLHRSIEITCPPKRIVSLVPSQTELLFDLGLENNICGITKFCVHPPQLKKTKTIIGGTKNLRMQMISDLQPDLIIANKEENDRAQIEILAKEFPVWISDIRNFADALEMIRHIGIITNTDTKAATIIEKIMTARETFTSGFRRDTILPDVIYLIWKDPYISVGGDTFIHAMLELAGFQNRLAGMARYPAITEDDLRTLNPRVVLLSSEPFPFKPDHCAAIQKILPDAVVRLADGEAFSWYGSRMQYAFEHFTALQKSISGSLSEKLP